MDTLTPSTPTEGRDRRRRVGRVAEIVCPLKNKKELEDLMEDMDDDGSGDIDFDEFYAWYKSTASKSRAVLGR